MSRGPDNPEFCLAKGGSNRGCLHRIGDPDQYPRFFSVTSEKGPAISQLIQPSTYDPAPFLTALPGRTVGTIRP